MDVQEPLIYLMKLETKWCVLVIDDSGPTPRVSNVLGPYEKEEANLIRKELDDEYDGSPYFSVVRSITRLRVTNAAHH